MTAAVIVAVRSLWARSYRNDAPSVPRERHFVPARRTNNEIMV
jgi:hypothetical protein